MFRPISFSFYEDKVNKKIQNLFNNKYREIFSSEMSFSDFVKAVASINDLVANRHFKSQYLFLTDKKQNLIVDFIGRFENLEKDFDFVLNKLNIKKNIELPHFNKTKHKHYSEYYTEETRKLVEKRYRKDIKMFGYKFEKKNV